MLHHPWVGVTPTDDEPNQGHKQGDDEEEEEEEEESVNAGRGSATDALRAPRHRQARELRRPIHTYTTTTTTSLLPSQ